MEHGAGMELRHLRYFVALTEELSFTKAAKKVNVTQSTLSHTISNLEMELGITLFKRTLKKVELTYAGQQLLQHAMKAMKELDSAVRELKHPEASESSTLRVGSTHVSFIIKPLALFMERFPSVKVHFEGVTADQLEKGVLEEKYDAGVGLIPAKSRDLWPEKLFSESLILLVHRDHALAARKRLRMIELHQQPLALLSREFAHRQLVDESLEKAEATPNVVAEFNSVRALIELIRILPIATIVPDRTVPPSPAMYKIPLIDPSVSRNVGLLWKKGHQIPDLAQAFASILKSTAMNRVFELW
jgi:LysR family cyn operon transcriptional activator